MILCIGFGFARNAVANFKLRREIESLQRRIAVLEMRNQELEREIVVLLSPYNVERTAREQLWLVKTGEILYMLSESSEE